MPLAIDAHDNNLPILNATTFTMIHMQIWSCTRRRRNLTIRLPIKAMDPFPKGRPFEFVSFRCKRWLKRTCVLIRKWTTRMLLLQHLIASKFCANHCPFHSNLPSGRSNKTRKTSGNRPFRPSNKMKAWKRKIFPTKRIRWATPLICHRLKSGRNVTIRMEPLMNFIRINSPNEQFWLCTEDIFVTFVDLKPHTLVSYVEWDIVAWAVCKHTRTLAAWNGPPDRHNETLHCLVQYFSLSTVIAIKFHQLLIKMFYFLFKWS